MASLKFDKEKFANLLLLLSETISLFTVYLKKIFLKVFWQNQLHYKDYWPKFLRILKEMNLKN